MDRRAELSEFLRSRRARLQPDDVGLAANLDRRRVPGLRREELSLLAGVSVDHYTRLEQGRAERVSDSVLDAVARALRLDDQEVEHLRRLARPVPPARRRPARPQRARPGLRQLVDAMGHAVPAYVFGRRLDLLAWNRLASALLGDIDALPPGRRNVARMVFQDERARDLYRDWEAKARGTVAVLRADAGRHPDDPELASLVGDLSVRSPDFRRMWAAHQVHDKTHGDMAFHHPLVGPLDLSYEALRMADDPDQVLVTYSAPPGSPDAAGLALLASLEAPPAPEPVDSVDTNISM